MFNIDENLILHFAGSNIASLFPRNVSSVLAIALIWAVDDEEMCSIRHKGIFEIIKSKIQIAIRLIENKLNPIQNVALIIATGSDGNLLIDEIETMNDDGTLTPVRGAKKQAAYMSTQVN